MSVSLRTLLAFALTLAAASLPGAEPPALSIPAAAAPPPLAPDADPAGWAAAALIDGLGASIDRRRTAPPRLLPTRVRLLWDADALYLRYECEDPAPYAPFSGRDEPLYQGDACEFFVDAVGDGRQWFELQVAPNGALFDSNAVLTADPVSDADGRLREEARAGNLWSWVSYDLEGVRAAAASRPGGWTATLAIPAKAITRRLGSTPFVAGQRLRANLLRYDWSEPGADGKRALTAMNWAPVVDGCPHISPQAMGTLVLAR